MSSQEIQRDRTPGLGLQETDLCVIGTKAGIVQNRLPDTSKQPGSPPQGWTGSPWKDALSARGGARGATITAPANVPSLLSCFSAVFREGEARQWVRRASAAWIRSPRLWTPLAPAFPVLPPLRRGRGQVPCSQGTHSSSGKGPRAFVTLAMPTCGVGSLRLWRPFPPEDPVPSHP